MNKTTFIICLNLIIYFNFCLSSFAWADPLPQAPRKSTSINSLINFVPEKQYFKPALYKFVTEINKGLSQQQKGEKEFADKTFNSLINTAQKDLGTINRGYKGDLFFLLGYTSEQLNQPKQALQYYQQSLSHRANNFLVLFRRAAVEKEIGHFEAALTDLKEVAWRSNLFPYEIKYLEAECLFGLKREEEALAALNNAHKLNPGFIPVVSLLVETYSQKLKTLDPHTPEYSTIKNELSVLLPPLIQSDQSNKEAILTYVQMLLENSNPLTNAPQLQQAETLIKKVVVNSNYSDEASIKLLFDIQIKRHNFTAASDTLKQGLSSLPKSSLLKDAQRQLEIEQALTNNPQ